MDIDTTKTELYAPAINPIISHFIEKDAELKKKAIYFHKSLWAPIDKFQTNVTGVNVYRFRCKTMTPMQLMLQMYNSYICCSKDILEIEKGKYLGWNKNNLQWEPRQDEIDYTEKELKENPEKEYLVQHCFGKHRLGVNLQDFFTFFAKIRDDDKVAVNYLQDVGKNIVNVEIFSTIKEEVTKPKKRPVIDVETTTPKKLRRHVELVNPDVLVEPAEKEEAKKPVRTERLAARESKKSATEKLNKEKCVQAISNYFDNKKKQKKDALRKPKDMQELYLVGAREAGYKATKDEIITCFDGSYGKDGRNKGIVEYFYPTQELLKSYNKGKWVDKDNYRMKFKEDWFKHDKDHDRPNVRDAFIAFKFNEEKLGDDLSKKMSFVKNTLNNVGWEEITAYPNQEDKLRGDILLFGKYELGKKLNDLERKEAFEDISTLSPVSKWGEVFDKPTMTVFKGSILNFANQLCNGLRNTHNYKQCKEFQFIEVASAVLQNTNQGVLDVCLFLRKQVSDSEMKGWEEKYRNLEVIKTIRMIQPNFNITSSPIADMSGKSFSFSNVDDSDGSSAGEEGKDDDNHLGTDDNKNAQNEAGNKQSDDVDGGKDEAEEEMGRTAEGDKKVISVLAEEGGKDEGAKDAEHDESEDHGEVAGKDDGDEGKESGDGADQLNATKSGNDVDTEAGKDDGDEGKESGDRADQSNINEEGNDVAAVSTAGTKRSKNVQSDDDDQFGDEEERATKKARKDVSNTKDDNKRLTDFEAIVQERLRELNKNRKQKKEFEYDDALKDIVKQAGDGKAGSSRPALVKWWDDIKKIFNSDMKPKGRTVNQVADEITNEILKKMNEMKGGK